MIHAWIPEWAVVDDGIRIGKQDVFSETFIARAPDEVGSRWPLNADAISWVDYAEQDSFNGWLGSASGIHVWAPMRSRPTGQLTCLIDFEGAAPRGFPRSTVRAIAISRVMRSRDGSLRIDEIDEIPAPDLVASPWREAGFMVGIRSLRAS